jgi:hypothetical protein
VTGCGAIVTPPVVWVEEPSVQVALESVQVGVGGAAADVTVRPDEIVRGHDHAKRAKACPVTSSRAPGIRLACQVVQGEGVG